MFFLEVLGETLLSCLFQLLEVKEESEEVGLKLNIQKTKEGTGLRRLLLAPAPVARCPLLPRARQPRPLPRPEDAGRVEGGRDAGPGGVHLGYPQLHK